MEVLLCGVSPVGAHWADEPEAAAGCDDCLELVAEDLADDNDYSGRCLHCAQEVAAKGGFRTVGSGVVTGAGTAFFSPDSSGVEDDPSQEP